MIIIDKGKMYDSLKMVNLKRTQMWNSDVWIFNFLKNIQPFRWVTRLMYEAC